MPGSNAPLSTCTVGDGEVGWCVESTCYRGCVNGMCAHGGTSTPIYNDCYCK